MIIRTNLVNIAEKTIFPAQITIKDGKIHSVKKIIDSNNKIKHYALCGFIDSHIHIESSMLVPSKFAQMAGHLCHHRFGPVYLFQRTAQFNKQVDRFLIN